MKKRKHPKILNENLHLYDSLRNEITTMESIQMNLWIAIYASYLTLFILAIELSHYILLLTFVILIPFQSQLLRYRWSIIRMSEYVKLFFELDRGDMHWELFHESEELVQYNLKFNKKLASILSYTVTVQLGLLSTTAFCSITLYQSIQKYNIVWYDVLFIIISIICLIITSILNHQYKEFGADIKPVIENFKIRIQEKKHRE